MCIDTFFTQNIIHIIKNIGKVITVRNYVIYSLKAGHIYIVSKISP